MNKSQRFWFLFLCALVILAALFGYFAGRVGQVYFLGMTVGYFEPIIFGIGTIAYAWLLSFMVFSRVEYLEGREESLEKSLKENAGKVTSIRSLPPGVYQGIAELLMVVVGEQALHLVYEKERECYYAVWCNDDLPEVFKIRVDAYAEDGKSRIDYTPISCTMQAVKELPAEG